MSRTVTVACVQMTAGREPGPNIDAAARLIREARAAGAGFILTPENTAMMEPKRALILEKAQPEDRHPALPAFRSLARETGAWLLVGSLAVKLDETTCANRSFLIDAAGDVVARYDKIHMFDVDLAGGESYRESATFRPGAEAVLAETPWGKLGMTVCYDLRFAYLYRALAQAGAEFLSVPAAFTRRTGEAHWHVLLRARAIETGCFVFAPAQYGEHAEGRKTFGHSLIVAPWGEVLADGGEGPGLVMAEIDPARVAEARRMVPALRHDRPFTLVRAGRPALRLAGE
ncbi:MAG: carbon-nitrogen hydrolase family protein [Rhodospirillaceae bacterium]|nr:carbon-nitrogen hydrolase family protein [Rhodospirillaceae bacterium]